MESEASPVVVRPDGNQIRDYGALASDDREAGRRGSGEDVPTGHGNIQDGHNEAYSTLDSNSDQPKPAPYSTKQILTLITLCALNTSSSMFYSLLAPFFPTEAKNQKGASETEVGLILGCFQVVNLIMCPVFGYYMTSIGSKFMVVAGNFVCSVCAILFGMLQWCPPGRIFVIMCFVSRSVEALGAAAQSTASFAIAAHTFPTRISAVMGFLQASSCVGLMVGPPVGGTLFAYGGYYLPFVVTGVMFMFFTLVCMCLLPQSEDTHSASTPFSTKLRVATIPFVLIVGYVVFLFQAAMGFMDIALSIHLDKIQKGISAVYVGLVFLVPSAIVVILAPIYGIITDKHKWLGRPFMVMGCVMGAVSFLVLGPAPFLTFIPRDKVWVVIVGLVISALGWGCMVVTYPQLVASARRYGLPENMETQGIIAGINGAFTSLGAIFGPTVGGVMLQHINFDWSCVVISGMSALGVIILLTYLLFVGTCCPESQYNSTVHNSEVTIEDEERTNLLVGDENRSIQPVE